MRHTESLRPVTARDTFPAWHASTITPESAFWEETVGWHVPDFLGRLLDTVDDEIEPRWAGSTEALSTFVSTVLRDVVNLEQGELAPAVAEQIHFIRFYISARAVNISVIHGRPSLVFDWLVCSITDRAFEPIEPGVPIEVAYKLDRLLAFVTSAHPVIRGTGLQAVLLWLSDLYYYSWKFSGLRDLAYAALPHARRLVTTTIERGEGDDLTLAIRAASYMSSWTDQAESHEARYIAVYLASHYENALIPQAGRKAIASVLATSVGRHTDARPSEWASRLIADHREILVQHEPVHYLIAACPNPDEMVARYDKLLEAVERYADESAGLYRYDPSVIGYRRVQLFGIISPLVRALLVSGHCRQAVALVATWFGVPREQWRVSPVLGTIPNHEDGVLYAVDGHAEILPRDTADAVRRLTSAVNHALDMSIMVRDDHAFEPHKRTGRMGNEPEHASEFYAAVANYYEIDRLHELLTRLPVSPTAVFQPHSMQTPLQTMALHRLGLAWPIVTSFEEPKPDRPVRKALIWSCGTLLGDQETYAIDAYLSDQGVECETHAGEDLTPEQFVRFYTDGTFDLIWVNAHGWFDAREPHLSHIKLSADGTRWITLDDLIRHTPPGENRRLLGLNICLGGSVAIIEAPPRLGLGAMLANRNQAVIAHLWEVSSFIAPIFGLLSAIGIVREGFFPGFCFAARNLSSERETIVALLREHAPRCTELIERVKRGTFGIDPEDLRTWGSPVFYE